MAALLPASGEGEDCTGEGAGEGGDGAEEGGGALLTGWDSCLAAGSAFAERAVNQLFVAAIACRTAWRPVSSLPFPDPAPFSRSPLS